jgi:molybdopterin-guanine dinucleotide biosynthesis protein A
MPDDAITFTILAGGAATRLGGRDKGLELLDGRPLIAWVLDAVTHMQARLANRSAAVPDVVRERKSVKVLIAANRRLDEYARYGETITDDAPGFPGPLAGVASALTVCTTDWLITLPVDCPAPPNDLAVRLHLAVGQGDVDAVAAHDGERRQPLFAIYRRTLASSASHAVAAGQGVWKWQTDIAARELDFSDRRQQFRNLNTPDDFVHHANHDDA